MNIAAVCIANSTRIKKCFPKKALLVQRLRNCKDKRKKGRKKGKGCGDRNGLLSDIHMLGYCYSSPLVFKACCVPYRVFNYRRRRDTPLFSHLACKYLLDIDSLYLCFLGTYFVPDTIVGAGQTQTLPCCSLHSDGENR